MKQAILETATLADAIAKASKVAPTGGATFGRTQGIVIELDPSVTDKVIVKATDEYVSFRQVVNAIKVECDELTTWRVNSRLLNGLAGTLPMGLSSQTVLFEKDNHLQLRCDSVKAKFPLIVTDYREIEVFDSTELATIPNLAQRLRQVAWATAKSGVMSGVCMDGEYLYATDTTALAMVPCKVPIPDGTTVVAPLSAISALLKNVTDVKMRATDARVQIMPDEWTQASSAIFAEPYPNVKWAIENFDKTQGLKTILLSVDQLVHALDRILVLVKSERIPGTLFTIKRDELDIQMHVPDVGRIADKIAVNGGSDESFTMKFNPEYLKTAVQASGQPTVWIDYGPTNLHPIRVRDDHDYVVVAMPIRPGAGGS